MTEPRPALPRRSQRLLQQWSHRWGVPGLEFAVAVTVSGRLRRSLGRCHPNRGTIDLRPDVLSAPRKTFDAVLCHEAAHIAGFLLHGRTVRPHGPEWAALVTAAGFDPVVRMGPPSIKPHRPRPPGYRFEHRCPVCQTTRLARRRMRGWRCAECVEAGLDGAMEIHPIEPKRRGE